VYRAENEKEKGRETLIYCPANFHASQVWSYKWAAKVYLTAKPLMYLVPQLSGSGLRYRVRVNASP
jgi:hypothetical protein